MCFPGSRPRGASGLGAGQSPRGSSVIADAVVKGSAGPTKGPLQRAPADRSQQSRNRWTRDQPATRPIGPGGLAAVATLSRLIRNVRHVAVMTVIPAVTSVASAPSHAPVLTLAHGERPAGQAKAAALVFRDP